MLSEKTKLATSTIAVSTSKSANFSAVFRIAPFWIAPFLISLAGCGVFASQKDHEALVAKNDSLEKSVAAEKLEVDALKNDLVAERERLDNALRANADRGSDLLGAQARVNDLAGRLDEAQHNLEELKKEVAARNTEVDARLDEFKRAEAVQVPQPPPITIPVEKTAHFTATQQAYDQKNWSLTNTLGREYVNRYPTDDKADDVSFLMGDADLQDNRPSTALGEFNRVLKATPPSNVLDKTLLAMGASYMLLHDCESAKLAYSSAEKRFAKTATGVEAKKRLAVLAHPAADMCAPR
jgi:TolA-binding protein